VNKAAAPYQLKAFKINTYESISKQRALTTCRMNTCEKQGERGASGCAPGLLVAKTKKGRNEPAQPSIP
jgi:hypothetical protein